MTFFKSILNFGKQALGLGKRSNKESGFGGLIKKAGSFISNGLKTLNSSPVKGLVSSVSKYLPVVGDVYSGLKNYGNIANNVVNGGAVERKGERIFKNSPALSSMDRLGNMMKTSSFQDYPGAPSGDKPTKLSRRDRREHREPTIEKTRTREVDNQEDWLGNDDTYSGLMQMGF